MSIHIEDIYQYLVLTHKIEIQLIIKGQSKIEQLILAIIF